MYAKKNNIIVELKILKFMIYFFIFINLTNNIINSLNINKNANKKIFPQ